MAVSGLLMQKVMAYSSNGYFLRLSSASRIAERIGIVNKFIRQPVIHRLLTGEYSRFCVQHGLYGHAGISGNLFGEHLTSGIDTRLKISANVFGSFS
jgi:hypothetical protein